MADLNAQAKAEWGKFRQWIAANPLTGFWCGVAVGFLGGGLLRGIL